MKRRAPGSFGARLKALREVAGYTQEELASIAGLSVQAVSALERGERRRPHVETVRALAAALDLKDEARDALIASARAPAPEAVVGTVSAGPLPVAPSPLLGRDRDLECLRQWLADPTVRLITLVGPGGVGKTRLALEVGHALTDDGVTRVVFVGLAAVRQAAFVASAIAEALGLSNVTAIDLPRLVQSVCDRGRPLLLVLDNCEQVQDAAPLVADLASACRSLRILATSRAALRVRGERLYVVEPLALRAESAAMPPVDLARLPAVRLFLERVREVQPTFRLTPANAPTVAAICRRLDALPLALELAARWLQVLSPDELLRRLERHARLPGAGARDLPERQRSIEATVAWSCQLLGPTEQRLFRRLGALPARFPIDAAAAVLAGRDDRSLSDDDVLRAAAGLIDKSLLLRSEGAASRRPLYDMLDTVRAYAAHELAAAGERDDALEGLVRYSTAEASLAAQGLVGSSQVQWLDRVREDLETHRAALTWLLAHGRAAEAVAIAWGLVFFWIIRGRAGEGLRWYEQILDLPRLPPAVESTALLGAGAMGYSLGEVERARTALTRALELARSAGDLMVAANAGNLLGRVEASLGHHDAARRHHARALDDYRALPLAWGVGNALTGMATVHLASGEPESAERVLDEAVAVLRPGAPWFLALALNLRATLAVQRGNADEAIAIVREILALIRGLHDNHAFVFALGPLAAAALLKGDDAWAARILATRDAVTERTRATVAVRDALDGLIGLTPREVRARVGPAVWSGADASARTASIDSVLGDIERAGAGRSPAGVTTSRLEVTHLPVGFVDRDGALLRLQGWFDGARGGECQVVFVTGEAGIGKTTLIDAFARSVAGGSHVRIGRGQCLAQYGMGEAYLPVLEAIKQLCTADPWVADVLRVHAPMWLMQLPSVVTPSDRELFAGDVAATTRERMLREMVDALDALTARANVLLVLEDLHWSDFSTLDLISYIARRRSAAHLMLVGSYRPADLIAGGHPLKAVKEELVAKRECQELRLDYLSEAAVGQHLALRFPGHRFPAALGRVIRERTGGNPLFMLNTIDYLIAERLIVRQDHGWDLTAPLDAVRLGVPDSIRQLVAGHVDRLDARDQRILEAGSVAGTEFSVAAVAAALDEDAGNVESRCGALSSRHQFISHVGAQLLPNGQTVGRFAFVHAVYRQVLYERLSPSRRVEAHRRIGRRGEEVYGERTNEIAAELAMHFEQGTDPRRAARYLHQAALNALQRSAYREAIALSRRGLELLATLPESDEDARQRLRLHVTLGAPLIATAGYAAPEVGSVYLQARELCRRLGPTRELPQVLWGLWTFHILRAELSTAAEVADQLLQLAIEDADSDLLLRGHWTAGITCTHLARFAAALEHFETALSLGGSDSPPGGGLGDALDAGVAVRGFAGWSRWFIGQPDRALGPVEDAVARARHLSEPHDLAHALAFAGVCHQLRRERARAQQYADEAIAVSAEHGLPLYEAMGRIVRGWALIGQGDDAYAAGEIRQGLAEWRHTGARLMLPHFLALLAEALTPAVDEDPGLRLLDEALALSEATGEAYYQAELHRLKGERLLSGGRERATSAASACFERALAVARQQEGLSFELRAAVSLVRVHRGQDRSARARDLILPVYERFQDGFDTLDLRDARRLLDAGASR